MTADMTTDITNGPESPPPLVVRNAVDLYAVGAVIYDSAGHFLMQLRDDKPGLPVRDHWALFGGGCHRDEAPEGALLRELEEELEFRPRTYHRFHNAVYAIAGAPTPVVSKAYFAIPADAAELAAMVQHEGRDRRLFPLDELTGLARIAPWDLCAILLYARAGALWS